MFKACSFYPEVEIYELIDKSLLKIDEYMHLNMHNLIRDMGREIVHRESPDNPGACIRLWCSKDISDVLTGHKGTRAVEAIILESPDLKDVPLNTKTFEKVAKLRLLQINHVQLYGSFQYLPKSLKCLRWHYCPMKDLPSDFCLENLVLLNMTYSNFEEFQAPLKCFKCLKQLIFSCCENLKISPKFAGLHRLEVLSFSRCPNLMGLDSTIGDLERLRNLNLTSCHNLRKHPKRICDLRSLETLDLNGCIKLKELPDDLGKLECLREVDVVGTAITRVPNSLGHSKNLEMLLLSHDFLFKEQSRLLDVLPGWLQPQKNLSQRGFLPSSLKTLQLENCNLCEVEVPYNLGSLSSLRIICFSKNKFHAIPFSLCDLPGLKHLDVSECPNLQSIPELPISIKKLSAYMCKSLERLPNLSELKRLKELNLFHCEILVDIRGLEGLNYVRCMNLRSCKTFGRVLHVSNLRLLRDLDLSHCESLTKITGLENLHSIHYINLFNCNALKNPFTENFFKTHYEHGGELDIGFCSNVVPDWFSYQVEGCSMSFNRPLHVESKFLGMFLWVVYGTVDETKNVYPKVTIIDETNGFEFSRRLWTTISFVENASINYIASDCFNCAVKGSEKMSIHVESYDFPTEDFVRKCGVHLLYESKDGLVHSLSVSSIPCFDSENEVTINHSSRKVRVQSNSE